MPSSLVDTMKRCTGILVPLQIAYGAQVKFDSSDLLDSEI